MERAVGREDFELDGKDLKVVGILVGGCILVVVDNY